MRKKITIGRKYKGDFTDLELKYIDLKIDTGAYTSAIHCHKIKTTEVDGKQILRSISWTHLIRNSAIKNFPLDNFKEKRIKSSFGSSEKQK